VRFFLRLQNFVLPLGILLLGAALQLLQPYPVEFVRNLVFDQYNRWQPRDEQGSPVVFVDIDEASLEKIGQFPWRRDVYSTILENLNSAEVSAIAFDIFFSEEDTQNPVKIFKEFNLNSENILNSDELFLGSMKNSNVILPLVGATKEVKKNNFSPKANIITKGEDPLNYLYNYQGYISSLDKFNNAAKGLGSISIIDSEDGILRYVPLILNIDNEIIPSLSLEAVRLFNKEKSCF